MPSDDNVQMLGKAASEVYSLFYFFFAIVGFSPPTTQAATKTNTMLAKTMRGFRRAEATE